MIERSDISDMLEQIEVFAVQNVPVSDISPLAEKVKETFGRIRAGLEKELQS
jgi:hypothetical protein